MKENADTENIEIKDITIFNEKGNRVQVAIKLYNSKLEQNFTIIVKMSKLVDWP